MLITDDSWQAVIAAPGFNLGLRCSADEILGIDYLPSGPEQAPRLLLARETVGQLRAWLKDPAFDFTLPLAPAGTPFQRRVWDQISSIPLGQTRSYGQIAALLGSGPRAVGGACGANPYPVVVPCHRVLAAGGGLGGFANARGGFLLDVKRWLLRHEGWQIPDQRAG
ncbi:methylated-DNA--[protein]-cysteine S-methyltransferase [Denitratisoma oestradiolicum]|uniref:methylated-DNA--[protein]-cysteine S-methyltransferase n=1 Tax=Denitratisoma oestradiolicum TaxID=311182 RepID=A0A6S6XXP4_9PROT|nr:methylated-DNA--[protein]-cysteine S-methyltransferase [Denitratisoma oestradiolicum]TWO81803.1 cysteine methyltransferase [Denitratisoma oestradiolicum]CAB1370764.1 Methylated-DNA--protein-cysteine methyltransferase [Denitratisoma oestradiolicum]